MTCTTMLNLLLDASPDELEGRGASPVAAHVRECARCGAVAARLLTDTRILATELSRRPERPQMRERSARPLIWAGALAAAALAFWIVPRHREAAPVSASPVAVVRPTREQAAAPAPALVRVEATRLAGAIAATPVRVVASQSVDPLTPNDENAVAVISRTGRRAAVLATRNEKITVVWLY